MLGSLWLRYVDQATAAAENGGLTLRELRDELEFAMRWAGVGPPEVEAGERTATELVMDVFRRAAGRTAPA